MRSSRQGKNDREEMIAYFEDFGSCQLDAVKRLAEEQGRENGESVHDPANE